MPTHKILFLGAFRKRMPSLSRDVRAVTQYYDTRLIHPKRLALELIEDAEQNCESSLALNYTSLVKGAGDAVTLRDELSGKEFSVTPSLVLNCGGAWADDINQRLSVSTNLIGGTLGSHLVMDRPDIAGQLGTSMLYFETQDFRASLVYALDDQHILLGTTDSRSNDPDNAVCSEEEIEYIFDALQQILPNANLQRSEIIFAYAGIRPLPASDSTSTGAISREHTLHRFEPDGERNFPLLTLVGGKWTTYRACAEEITDVVLERIGTKRRKTTLNEPIGGGRGFSEVRERTLLTDLTARDLDPAVAARLIARYGVKALEVGQTVLDQGGDPLTEGSSYFKGEIAWIITNEQVGGLADIVMRRTLMPFEGAITRSSIREIAMLCTEILGWTEKRQAVEIETLTNVLKRRHLVPL